MPYKPGGAKRDWRDRFIEKVDRRGRRECWPWLGAVNAVTGYGVFHRGPGKRLVSAHVAAVEYFSGEAPAASRTVDHVAKRGCTRKDCVNPAHLEVVSMSENLRRAKGDACALGHDRAVHSYTRANGQRYCRVCAADKQRSRRGRQRESKQKR